MHGDESTGSLAPKNPNSYQPLAGLCRSSFAQSISYMMHFSTIRFDDATPELYIGQPLVSGSFWYIQLTTELANFLFPGKLEPLAIDRIVRKKEDAWLATYRILFPTLPPGTIEASAHTKRSNGRHQRGDGLSDCYSCTVPVFFAILCWCMQAPRRMPEARENASLMFRALAEAAIKILAPPIAEIRLSLVAGAGPLYVNMKLSFLDLAQFWLSLGQHPEVVIFTQRYRQLRMTASAACCHYDLDFIPIWALSTAIFLLCTPHSKFPALHAVSVVLLAQCANLCSGAMQALLNHKSFSVNGEQHVSKHWSGQRKFSALEDELAGYSVCNPRLHKDI